MGILDQEKVDRIKLILKSYPRGMTISNLSSKMKMNRNLIAKYLDMLLISGQVGMEMKGAAKVYYPSHLIPVSAMLKFSSDLVIMLDSERKILQVNDPLLTLLNATRDSLLGKGIDEIDMPFFRDLPISSDAGTDEQITEMSSVLQGEKHYFRVKQVPTAFEDGSQGTTLISENITTQMKYRLMLEMREATYRGIVEDQAEQINKGLYRSTGDPKGRFLWGNVALANILGYNSMLELQGINVIEIFTESDMRGELIGDLRRNGFVKDKVLYLKRKDGIPITVVVTAVAEFNEKGEVVFINGVVQDSTKSIQMESNVPTPSVNHP